MALHWRPVGPEPAETYWRRRAVLAAVAVLLALLVAFLLRDGDEAERLSGDSAGPAAAPSGSPAAAIPTGPPEPSAAPSPGGSEPCPASGLTVRVGADKDSYPVGGRPVLELAVTNTSAAPCTLDLGQGAVELLIFSGSDRIWSSDDCASGRDAKITTLEPGKPAVTRLTWAGRRSLPGCEGPKAEALPGTYRVSGRVGDQRVQGGSFRIVD